MKNIAVILLNLGGPDSKEAIKPFLMNFFMDPAIIGLPKIFRRFVAYKIAVKRSKGEAGDGYALLGYKSPLLENSQKQAKALETLLIKEKNVQYKTYVSMRYWHPMTDEVVAKVKQDNPDEIILLPLYPQFSTTTTDSSFKAWDEAAKKQGLGIKTRKICCYPQQDGFVNESAKKIKKAYLDLQKTTEKENLLLPRLLFSAHGLPEKIIKKGDPYQWQCEQTAKAIVDKLDIPNLDWKICYQSRVGPLKWIGPSTEEALREAGKENRSVVIYPHAFVSEHIETLIEIGIEYKELAEACGVPYFVRVETVGTGGAFIKGLAALVTGSGQCGACPSTFGRCWKKEEGRNKKHG